MTFVVYMVQIFLKEACEKVKFNSKTIIVSLRDCPFMSHAVLISNILHLFCPINEIDEKHFSFTFTLISLGRCVLKIILLLSPLQEIVERPQEL